MNIALGDLAKKFKEWISSKVQIDHWSLDLPDPEPTIKDGILYPSNTCVQLPPRRVSYEQTQFGLLGSGEFRFRLDYRFDKAFRYDQIPLKELSNLINNLYYKAVLSPASIHPAIKSIRTPDSGIDLVVGHVDEGSSSDWLVSLQIDFYCSFKAELGDLGGLQPGEEEKPFILKQLEIGIYRAKIGNFDENRLDRTIIVDKEN